MYDFKGTDILSIYKDIVVVKELIGYDEELNPLYGKRLGIYHPLLSSVFLLDQKEWFVYDSIGKYEHGIVIKDLLLKRKMSELFPILDVLCNHKLIINNSYEQDFVINPNFTMGSMYIKTTEGCNFACPGCATSSDLIPANKARTLNKKTTELFLESFVRSCAEKNLSQAEIKWAGGEPLLANSYTIIKECQPLIEPLKHRYPQIEITQNIITNGVFLNDEIVQFGIQNDIHFAVSLWGTAEFQDKMRRPRNKQETFPIIIDNIQKLHKAGGKFNLIYVLAPYNASDYVKFLSIVWDTTDPEYIGRAWDIKKPIPLAVSFYRAQSPLQAQAIERSLPLVEKALKRGFQKSLELIQKGIALPPLYKIDYLNLFDTIITPCGTGYTYIAVGPDGATSCHEGLYQMQQNLERIKKGENLFDVVNEEYSKDRDLLLGNNIEFPSEKARLLAFHGGQGCPRSAKHENGGKLGNASTTSKLYAAIFEDILSLETMRQMKYG